MSVDDYDRMIDMFRGQVERLPGQRVSHVELMAAASCLTQAARLEAEAGNAHRASEINHLVLATFRAAIRVEDIANESEVPS